jgi:hypothetical protein
MTGAHTSNTAGTQTLVNATNNPYDKKADCILFLPGYKLQKTRKRKCLSISKLTEIIRITNMDRIQ